MIPELSKNPGQITQAGTACEKLEIKEKRKKAGE